jgi:trans-2,3-dihydro-3-hydroxyanthranilate isomerase
MENQKFYIVDVFAEKKYGGNQLAVIKVSDKLSTEEMQSIAFEFNFSETTFIISEDNNNHLYDVRIFTPREEIPFAGHPTLGTSFIIQHEILKKKVFEISLNLKAGKIPVELVYKNDELDILWMKQLEPTFGEVYSIDIISKILGINKNEIDDNFPIQAVSTGLPGIIVPLKTLDSVKKSRINKELYFDFIKDKEAKSIFIFAPETYSKENNINVRDFGDYYGIPEDPSTGSINGCLAGYLVKHSYFGKDNINIRVEQGYEINRPSLLYLKSYIDKGSINIFVGGRVIKIGEGFLE